MSMCFGCSASFGSAVEGPHGHRDEDDIRREEEQNYWDARLLAEVAEAAGDFARAARAWALAWESVKVADELADKSMSNEYYQPLRTRAWWAARRAVIAAGGRVSDTWSPSDVWAGRRAKALASGRKTFNR